jgi:proteasome lid subunit RPN8/RPN11
MLDKWEMALRVTRSVLNQLLGCAREATPDECCGILLGRGILIEEARPTANVAADRTRRFEIDPQALVDAHRTSRGGGPRVLGYFHSHPNGPAEPSVTDRQQAANDESIWAIIGEAGVTFWRDREAGFVPLSYTIEDR